jgi:hypothetical protein
MARAPRDADAMSAPSVVASGATTLPRAASPVNSSGPASPTGTSTEPAKFSTLPVSARASRPGPAALATTSTAASSDSVALHMLRSPRVLIDPLDGPPPAEPNPDSSAQAVKQRSADRSPYFYAYAAVP